MKALLIDILVIAGIFSVGVLHGCACITGAVRGGIEGARHDISAAQAVAAPGTPDTYLGQPLPGRAPEGKGMYYED